MTYFCGMGPTYFVAEHSIVRRIWGNGDIIMMVFAGSAAEFALNKAVDWLYFTGKLPKDPLARLFSTMEYARRIVFSENEATLRTIDAMAAVHAQVEQARGMRIPDWAYRDVLFMLIDYSIRAYELLEGTMTLDEKREVFQVFNRVGVRMGLKGLPDSFEDWLRMRETHLTENLARSKYTEDLYCQYRKHLGFVRYRLLIESQIGLAPIQVRRWMKFRRVSLLPALVGLYQFSRKVGADRFLKTLLLPPAYARRILALDQPPELTSGNGAQHSPGYKGQSNPSKAGSQIVSVE